MKNYLTSLALGTAFLACAHAEDFKLPEKSPVVTFSFPEKWETEKYDEGVEATSEDEEVYVAIENVSTKGVAESMESAIKYLKGKGVTAKNESLKQKEAKLNGMDVVDLSWDGTDKEGACKISVIVVAATEDKGVLVIYWASEEGEKKNQADLTKLIKSIKPTAGAEKVEKPEKAEKKEAKEEKEDEEEK